MSELLSQFPRPTPPGELDTTRSEQQKEVGWWEHIKPVTSFEDIQELVSAGEAVTVENGESYRISARAPEEFNVLRRSAARLLHAIAAEWKSKIDQTELFLVVTSLARTDEYQSGLSERGYPTVAVSSHTKLVAFDIATEWFTDNNPVAEQYLYEVLAQFQSAGKLNFIREATVGVVHVCVHPSYE